MEPGIGVAVALDPVELQQGVFDPGVDLSSTTKGAEVSDSGDDAVTCRARTLTGISPSETAPAKTGLSHGVARVLRLVSVDVSADVQLPRSRLPRRSQGPGCDLRLAVGDDLERGPGRSYGIEELAIGGAVARLVDADLRELDVERIAIRVGPAYPARDWRWQRKGVVLPPGRRRSGAPPPTGRRPTRGRPGRNSKTMLAPDAPGLRAWNDPPREGLVANGGMGFVEGRSGPKEIGAGLG